MKMYETVQRAGSGGAPVPSGHRQGFGHGTPVMVVGKRELADLAARTLAHIHKLRAGVRPRSLPALIKELEKIAKKGEDFFEWPHPKI